MRGEELYFPLNIALEARYFFPQKDGSDVFPTDIANFLIRSPEKYLQLGMLYVALD